MFIDIPSEKLLPELEKGIREQIEKVMLPEVGYLGVDRLEWTAEGLRVWMLTGK